MCACVRARACVHAYVCVSVYVSREDGPQFCWENEECILGELSMSRSRRERELTSHLAVRTRPGRFSSPGLGSPLKGEVVK